MSVHKYFLLFVLFSVTILTTSGCGTIQTWTDFNFRDGENHIEMPQLQVKLGKRGMCSAFTTIKNASPNDVAFISLEARFFDANQSFTAYAHINTGAGIPQGQTITIDSILRATSGNIYNRYCPDLGRLTIRMTHLKLYK